MYLRSELQSSMFDHLDEGQDCKIWTQFGEKPLPTL